VSEGLQRAIVFLDWQNVYRRARDCFHSAGDDHHMGQVNPLDLAQTLAERGPDGTERELAAVRIYRGMPDNKYDSTGYDAARRQNTAWLRDDRVVVEHRNLRYPDDWVKGTSDWALVKEKGVDVALAVDFVTMATDGLYEVGILMSCDHDLLPALERVDQRHRTRGDGPVIEVAAWKAPYGWSHRLSLPDHKNRPFCHWLKQEDYWGLQDTRDYTRPSPADIVPAPIPRRR